MVLLAGIGDLKDQQGERQLISRMLTNHTVDFLWNTGSDWPGWPAQDNKATIFNRYGRAGFTSKVPEVTSADFFQSGAHRTGIIHACKKIDCFRWACVRTSDKCTGTTRLEWRTPFSHVAIIYARAIRRTLSSKIFGESYLLFVEIQDVLYFFQHPHLHFRFIPVDSQRV